ncbi:XkdF-like putative serine protease domain-containing protein [Bacillus haynesii]|uniref:XkdF-like putative serine protease domain-containing protein n=1 Tax=Bacillus haynesii TaxID=1925021 RepID=UPI0022809600|nr:XkdF-like putative serine protease domain-containing protein [Bacillus haynesii]MCY8346817.1 XkdF-like putative serine protease domain-containing protein [Bacillus haynesii]MCY8352525.1 XkdF-like putative serine protease domain-containing protein [Bacillus haynesii]MCY8557972.1 XkdF-like putative serine protease domain-containing protein [Bacillus haynesii]
MPRELVNAKITHVSYVDKAANQKQFFFMKSEKQPDFQKEIKVLTKAEDEKKLVYGIVYEPDTLDAHGDFMTAAEIEKAAHGFLKDAREIDKQHDFQGGVGEVVESYVAPADFEVNGETIKKGSWVLVTKASDEVWEQIKKGEITGYSMAGTAETIEKQKEKSFSHSANEEKGLFNLLKNFFTKGEVQDRFNYGRSGREFWAAQDALNSVLFNWRSPNEEMETDPEKIREALQDFVNIAQEILIVDDIQKAIGPKPEELQKAGRKISAANLQEIKSAHTALGNLLSQTEAEKEEDELKKEDIEKLLDDKLNPITKRLDEIEKEAEPAEGDGKDEEQSLVKQMDELLEQKLSPIQERLEAVEKSRGISKQAGSDQESDKEEVKKSVWDGLL